MRKPILATNLDGFLIKHEAFSEPHKAWFKRAISLTKNKSLDKWIGREDYFKGVDEAMKEIMPNATSEERTEQARKWYQEEVLVYIKSHPEVVYRTVAKELIKLKKKYTITLITSNSRDYIEKILSASNLDKVYSIIFSTETSEKPDKKRIIKRFINTYEKPVAYLTGKSEEKIPGVGTKVICVDWKKTNPKKVLNFL